MGAHNNPLGKAILMSTHNIGFNEDMTKIIFHLSSNTHLISSSVVLIKVVVVKKINLGRSDS